LPFSHATPAPHAHAAAFVPPTVTPLAAPPPGTPATTADAPAPETAEPAAAENVNVLKSPIVGTFYRSPAPDAAPYVEVGSRVRKGQVVCIIEAMKLMNEIEAEWDGVITEAYAQNAQPVEFGEPLFGIKQL
jgi:acetyl-CoA carboxylase biotin carboxyl carrier protein